MSKELKELLLGIGIAVIALAIALNIFYIADKPVPPPKPEPVFSMNFTSVRVPAWYCIVIDKIDVVHATHTSKIVQQWANGAIINFESTPAYYVVHGHNRCLGWTIPSALVELKYQDKDYTRIGFADTMQVGPTQPGERFSHRALMTGTAPAFQETVRHMAAVAIKDPQP